MNKKRSEWANEEGSALVLTLMIFLVLTVLATSISFLTVGSFRLSDINRDGTSAFYIAEAGAKKAYQEASQEVMKTYEAATTTTSSNFYAALDALFLNKELSFDKQFGDDAKANVTFTATGSNPRKYTLTSTGSVGGKTRTVQKQFDVAWVDKGGSGGFPALPEKAALITQGKTTFSGGAKVIGDIHTSSVGDKSIKFSGGATFENTTLFYPNTANKDNLFVYENNITGPKVEPTTNTINFDGYKKLIDDYVVPIVKEGTERLPETTYTNSKGKKYKVIDHDGNLNVDSWQIDKYFQLDLIKDIKIPTINIDQNKTLKINTNGQNRTIFVDNLDMTNATGRIEIIGKGLVTLVINGKVSFNTNTIINSIENKDQLLIVYTGTEANFSNMTNFFGNLIIKNENATVNLNQSAINGIVLTDVKKISIGNWGATPVNMIFLAPFASVEMTSGVSIYGSIIAKTFTINGGARLTYKPIDTSGFPVGSGGPSKTPTLEDLLQSGPILEQ